MNINVYILRILIWNFRSKKQYKLNKLHYIRSVKIKILIYIYQLQ